MCLDVGWVADCRAPAAEHQEEESGGVTSEFVGIAPRRVHGSRKQRGKQQEVRDKSSNRTAKENSLRIIPSQLTMYRGGVGRDKPEHPWGLTKGQVCPEVVGWLGGLLSIGML